MNNNILFNLNKFRKFKNNSYDNIDNCKKNSYKYGHSFITNPKFKSFDQKYYTAGDFDDFNIYGNLSSLFYLSLNENNNNNNNNKLSINNNQEYFKLYDNIDIESIINTFTYIFEKLKKGIFIIIHNNKIVLFLPFSNYYYINNWYDKIYFSLDEQKLLQENDYNKIKHLLQKNTIDFMKKHPQQFHLKHKLDFNRQKWHANNCVFRNTFPPYEGDLNINVFKNMFDELCKNRTIPNVQFFVNYRDAPILKKNLTEPYHHLFDSYNTKIETKYQFKKFAPILSQSITNDYADILIPTSDDWIMNSKKFYTNKCSNSYINNKFHNIIDNWNKKKNICVFRGSATGCGILINNNMRLKAAQLSLENPDILDAGITDWKARDKKYIGNPIQIINPKNFKFDLVKSLNRYEQSQFKYILHIDGYVSAFRLSSELRLHSTLLIVDSNYKIWFKHLLKPYVHFIPIKNDLSDLVSQIKWCINNDHKCKTIASNSYSFYQKYLTKDALFDYLQKTMNNIYLHRNLKNPLNITFKNKNVAIIVCFRDPGDNSRNIQKNIFIKSLSSIFSKLFNFHIFIIEQSPNGGFNIGKLKNIGFIESLKFDKFDHFIFSDVDMLPDFNLLKYYQIKPTHPIILAATGTRYNSHNKKNIKPFMGGCISMNKSYFKKINGYPNNFRNWGGEDDALMIRMVNNNLNTLVYPKNGSIIDIEMNNIGKKLNVKKKINKLKNNGTMELLKYEKLLLEFDSWKNNGLNNLHYKILNSSNINSNTTQISVDLLYDEEEKKYPELFPTNNSNNNYLKYSKNCKNKLKDEYYKKIKIIFK